MSYALPRCPLAQDFVLRVGAFSQTWLARVAARAASARRCLAEQLFVCLGMCYFIGVAVCGASVFCFTGATMLRQCSREDAWLWVEVFAQGCSDGVCANTQEHITICARTRGLTRTYMRMISGVRVALFSNRLGERPQWSPNEFGHVFGEGDALRPMDCPTRCRAAPWRRILSCASEHFLRHGLRA